MADRAAHGRDVRERELAALRLAALAEPATPADPAAAPLPEGVHRVSLEQFARMTAGRAQADQRAWNEWMRTTFGDDAYEEAP